MERSFERLNILCFIALSLFFVFFLERQGDMGVRFRPSTERSPDLVSKPLNEILERHVVSIYSPGSLVAFRARRK